MNLEMEWISLKIPDYSNVIGDETRNQNLISTNNLNKSIHTPIESNQRASIDEDDVIINHSPFWLSNPHSKASIKKLRTPIPKLKIVLMAVGTR